MSDINHSLSHNGIRWDVMFGALPVRQADSVSGLIFFISTVWIVSLFSRLTHLPGQPVMFIDYFHVLLYGVCKNEKKKLSRLPGWVITWSKVNPLVESARFHETRQSGKSVEKISYNQILWNTLNLSTKLVNPLTEPARLIWSAP